MPIRIFNFLLLSCFFLYGCVTNKKIATANNPSPHSAMREFRAAWVATVANINWPSKPGLSTADQKKEALSLLEYLKQNNFNAVILQVRPQADALYQSNLEPWSYYLTGEQGKAPEPFYDPLQFWIEEAHNRGIELHVWLNPYRAHHRDGKEITQKSIVKTRPELVVYLKEGYWWMDPALKGTQEHSAAVVMDIVKRYDIDGVHFDDYFYPYPSYNLNEDFPDTTSWKAYLQGGGKLSKGDWRRQAVNVFIEDLYKKIKAEKPYVKFGISPFGIWRPYNPPSIEGFDQYEQLYADAKLWLNKGWIDYFTPQLYFHINRIPQSFPVLLGWWQGENKMQRHLWSGLSVGTDTSAKNVNEIMSQVMVSRGMLPQSMGEVHWSISQLTRSPQMTKGLINGPYKKNALVPASPWLDNKIPTKPTFKINQLTDSTLKVEWSHKDESNIFRWVVYQQYGNKYSYTILNKNDRTLILPYKEQQGKSIQPLKRIAVTGISRTGNESETVWVEVK